MAAIITFTIFQKRPKMITTLLLSNLKDESQVISVPYYDVVNEPDFCDLVTDVTSINSFLLMSRGHRPPDELVFNHKLLIEWCDSNKMESTFDMREQRFLFRLKRRIQNHIN